MDKHRPGPSSEYDEILRQLLAACEALIRRWEMDHPNTGRIEGDVTFFGINLPYNQDRDCPEVKAGRAAIAKARGNDGLHA